jgi:hypothetical protein
MELPRSLLPRVRHRLVPPGSSCSSSPWPGSHYLDPSTRARQGLGSTVKELTRFFTTDNLPVPPVVVSPHHNNSRHDRLIPINDPFFVASPLSSLHKILHRMCQLLEATEGTHFLGFHSIVEYKLIRFLSVGFQIPIAIWTSMMRHAM